MVSLSEPTTSPVLIHYPTFLHFDRYSHLIRLSMPTMPAQQRKGAHFGREGCCLPENMRHKHACPHAW